MAGYVGVTEPRGAATAAEGHGPQIFPHRFPV